MPDDDLTTVKVQLAVLNGKMDTLAEVVAASERQSAQLIGLLRDQLTFTSADIGTARAETREAKERHERAITTVRLDLETAMKKVEDQVDELRLWRAKVAGVAAAAALFSSALTGLVFKALGM